MDRFDFSPLFRSTIGFDRLTRLVDAATRVDNAALTYPPYNIEKTGEDSYRLSMAVAGFAPEEIDLTVQENSLLVTGKAKKEDENGRYLHRGIARRAFERRFSLADHIKVVGANLENGRHRPTRVRAALQPRRPHQGRRRQPRKRHAACRPRPRGARGGQAAQDCDRHRPARTPPGHRKEGRLTDLMNAERPRFSGAFCCGAQSGCLNLRQASPAHPHRPRQPPSASTPAPGLNCAVHLGRSHTIFRCCIALRDRLGLQPCDTEPAPEIWTGR